MADDASTQRPLPECLTRFLSDPAPQALPLPARPFPRIQTRDAQPAAPNHALPVFLAWVFAFNVVGFVIIGTLWQSMR